MSQHHALVRQRRVAAIVIGVFLSLVAVGVAFGASAAVKKLWPEREELSNPVSTFRNHHSVSGLGQKIAAGRTVLVSCKVYDPSIPSVKPAGYWYRIASKPWSNHYYAPANTFLNGDPPHGPFKHPVDRHVANC
jgi:hypothetical protein